MNDAIAMSMVAVVLVAVCGMAGMAYIASRYIQALKSAHEELSHAMRHIGFLQGQLASSKITHLNTDKRKM